MDDSDRIPGHDTEINNYAIGLDLFSSNLCGNTESKVSLQDAADKRHCWVCFASEDEDIQAEWVQPCKCKGSSKWVHQSCLQRWIDEKQRNNTTAKVSCSQCNSDYIILFPRMGPLVIILDTIDGLIYRVCPFIAAGVVIGCIYWTAVTYGAVTVMQVVGPKDGLAVMDQADPLVLLVGLPTIPVMLIFSKMINWEDTALVLLREHLPKIPLMKYVFPIFNKPTNSSRTNNPETPPLSDPLSGTRLLCGALLFPSMAVLFGKTLFEHIKSNLKRTFFGGLTYLVVKGVLKIYHKQSIYVRQCQRKIMDFSTLKNETGRGFS